MTTKRQGDLLFIQIKKSATTTKVKPNPDGRVLAHGEATGHTHAIAEADLSRCDVFIDAEGRLVVEVAPFGDSVGVEHQEHARVVLEPGAWEVRRQREYEPSGWRQVAD